MTIYMYKLEFVRVGVGLYSNKRQCVHFDTRLVFFCVWVVHEGKTTGRQLPDLIGRGGEVKRIIDFDKSDVDT